MLMDVHPASAIAVLALTTIVGALLQSVAPIGAAWLMGIRDPRLRPLARISWRRSFNVLGWLLLPLGTATLVTLGVPVPVWGFGNPLIAQTPVTAQERREWRWLQLSVIPALLFLAILCTMPFALIRWLSPHASALALLATAIKQLLALALLHLVPVPPFALGRAFPRWWHDRVFTRFVQGMLLAAVVVDALAGRGGVFWVLGTTTDLLTALLLVLT